MRGDGIDKYALIAPPRGALPQASAGDPKAARAWQREMERAQMQAWLSHSLLTFASWARPAVSAPDEVVAGAAGATAASQPAALGSRAFSDAYTHPHMPRANALGQDEALVPVNEYEDGPSQHDADPAGLYSFGAASMRGFERQYSPDRSLPDWSRHAARGESRDLDRSGRLQSPFSRISTERLAFVIRDLAAEVSFAFAGRGGQPGEEGEGFVSPCVAAASSQRGDSTSKASLDLVSNIPATGGSPATPLTTGLPRESVPAQTRPVFSLERATTTHTMGNARLAMVAPRGQEAAAREPIRLHADWSSDGVRLWLGLDASLAAALPTIAAQLQRWLSIQGVRLLSISCNGRPVGDPEQAAAADRFEDDEPANAAALSVAHPILKETP